MAEAANAMRIAACVLNAFLSYTTIMLNIITILALRKTSALQKNLKTWLLSLSFADLGVGLLVQPLYIALLVMTLNQQNGNMFTNIKQATIIVTNLLCLASFFGITAISADRFLAIHLHLRYQELVTHKRVVVAVISIWVFSAFLSLLTLLMPWSTAILMIAIIVVVCLIAAALFHIKIYLVVRRHAQRNALHAQQVAQNDEQGANAARHKKTSVAVFYVYLVLLVCYLPTITLTGVTYIGKISYPSSMDFFNDWLLFLNSSLNPLIYCWKMRHIYQTIINILQNIIPRHN